MISKRGYIGAIADRCASVCTDGHTVVPAWSGTNAPFYGAAFFLGGSDPRKLAPVAWDIRWPNFLAFEEARVQGGLSVAYNISAARVVDPRGDVVSFRPQLKDYYRDAAVALEGAAWAIPATVYPYRYMWKRCCSWLSKGIQCDGATITDRLRSCGCSHGATDLDRLRRFQ